MKKLIFPAVFLCLLSIMRVTAQNGTTCADAYPVASLPFILTNMTTEGSGNDYNNTHACNSSYMSGNDFVFSYTPVSDIIVSIALSNAVGQPIPFIGGNIGNVGLFVVQGCPDDTVFNACIDFNEAFGGNPQLPAVNLIGGITYYILVSTNDIAGTNSTTAFDINISEVLPEDGGVSNISSPVSGYNLSANEQLIVTLTNFGTSSIVDFDVAYSINGGIPVSEFVGAEMLPGESLDYTFSSTLDLSAAGTYTITSYTVVSGDVNTENDSTTIEVVCEIPPVGAVCSSAEVVTGLPYLQTGLTTDGFNNDYGITDACNGLDMTGNDFVFEYTPQTDQNISVVLTNALGTFSFLTFGMLGQVGLYITEGCPDDPLAVCVASAEEPAGDPRLDAVQLTAGITYYFTISTNDLLGQNSSTGFDIEIYEALTLDGGVEAITSPVSGYELTANEQVTIRIRNYGSNPISNFGVEYQVNMGAAVTGTVIDTILPGATFDFTFPDVANISDPGSYYIIARTMINSDLLPDNNEATAQITNMVVPTGSRCEDPFVINSLPFVETDLFTGDVTNNYDASSACGSQFMTGNDYVFSYTPAQNQDVRITLTNAEGTFLFLPPPGNYLGMVGVFVTDNCPDDTTANCVASNEATAGNPVIDMVSLSEGTTYYIIVATSDLFGQNSTTAFDIEIKTMESFDVGVSQLVSPVSAMGLTSDENISIMVENFGFNTVSDFDVAYCIDGGAEVVETINDIIISEGVLQFTFATNANLSEIGHTYSIKAYTLYSSDNNLSNDTITTAVLHKVPQGANCDNPHPITTLTFESNNLTTLGFINDFNDQDACLSAYMNRNDYVFKYTPSTSKHVNIYISNSTPNIGLFVTKNCPDNVSAECIASVESTSENPSLLNVGFDPWITYYITVSSDINDQTDFDIKILDVQAGISEIENSGISIYPNPVDDILFVDLPESVNSINIDIYNVNGQKVYSHTLNQKLKTTFNINIEGYASGLYLVKINVGKNDYSKRIVVE